MSQPDVISITKTDRGRFFLRLAMWLGAYALILVAWGERNAWPQDLLLPVLSLPVTLVVARHLYRSNQITLLVRQYESQWALLISFLLLAVGLGSGLMLLMAVGWISIGVALLRPAQAGVPWDEWFKLPLLCLLTLPVVSDLAGTRHEWLGIFAQGAEAGNDPQPVFVAQLCLRAVVFTLVLKLSGPVFWGGLAFFPVAFFLGERASSLLVNSRYAIGYLLVFAAIFGVSWRVLKITPPADDGFWRKLTTSVLNRPQSPWLAGLVIALQQSALVERWLAGSQPKLEIVGVAFLLAILLRLRWRGPPAPLHVFSQILLASALFVLLAGEWTDLNFLRQISLGLLIISALSWNRAWSRYVLALALLTWISVLPAAAAILTRAGMTGDGAGKVRLGAMTCCLILLAAVTLIRTQTRSQKQYTDHGWMPVKRFALILLLLLAGFQIASVHWPPGSDSQAVHRSDLVPVLSSSRSVLFFHAARAERWPYEIGGQPVDLLIASPHSEPVGLQSPELILKASGWVVTSRRLLAHAHGQVVELTLERQGKISSALCWFQLGDQTFTHYLRARNILWSGWNLNRRDLRLIIFLAERGLAPGELVQFADAQNWFLNSHPAANSVP